jgi:AcrR family transcriptional regulator
VPKPAIARKSPTQDRARITVEALLDATEKLLVAEGYDKASTNRIAAKAGVSVGSLYQYFDSKDALVRAVGERHHDEVMGVLASAAADVVGKPLDEMVEAIIGAMCDAHAVNPELHRVLSEQIPREVIASKVEEDGASFLLALFATHADIVRKDIDPEIATFLLVHAVEGVCHSAALDRPKLLEDKRLVKDLARMVSGYLR